MGVGIMKTFKKPKYLSACDREDRGRGEGVVCMCDRVVQGVRDGEGTDW